MTKFQNRIIQFSIALLQFASLLPKASAQNVAEEKSYYVERRSYGTQKETDPPRYVKAIQNTWLKDHTDIGWLDLGLEYRFRYEHRDNDFRRGEEAIDNPFLHRTRFYVQVRNVIDPIRFTIEVQDSQRRNSEFDPDNRDINHLEPIQAYSELYFKDALGNNRPLSLRAGRMAFEVVDRRLIARNEWRNTTNTFFGVRSILGKKENDWQLDAFALQPLERRIQAIDDDEDSQWFYGAVGDWRRWSEIVSLQPYYLTLRQDGDKVPESRADNTKIDREIHTVGLRGYGVFDKTGLDYDLNVVHQYGKNGTQNHHAYGYIAEGGYTAPLAWKPRFAASYATASGDRIADDNSSQRFDRLFGFARPWSNNDYFQMENIVTPKLRVEFTPLKDLKIDAGYSWYYLDSVSDRWAGGNGLRDTSGESAKDVGEEVDLRVRFPVTAYVGVNLGYAYFNAGSFTRAQTPGRDPYSHFFYSEISLYGF